MQLGRFATLSLAVLIGCGGAGARETMRDTKPAAAPRSASSALASWNDVPSRRAIVDFVERVTTEGSRDYVAPDARIAVFDNDGTLWAEQPMPFELAFAVDRVRELAPSHPEWRAREPFAGILRGDVAGAMERGGRRGIAELIAATHGEMTPEEFERVVREWMSTARHPRYDRRYSELVYQPMLELLDYLRAHEFRVYIVSGGDTDFMRAWAEDLYGVPPAHVIGSQAQLRLERRGGVPTLVRGGEIEFVDDGPGKPIAIERTIGARPIAAFGNSDGDHEMLSWVASGPGPRFVALVHHTDAEREFAYDRDARSGRLAAALDDAQRSGWTVIDMRDDWRVVYPPE
ncbi:HAD family hydrolase [Sandaracinus amylolyticus]|uniref:Haloacid dehalogenase-like hydrolase n=1 Tax=Sandaracinus amylolyticus TaxID=927083 RepID=A0A0F6YHN9_9BACT|nr:HAD family hydrolase [Sandaracinus amylolyticus]AKF04916.1 Hypothetical protein DB32_002065 [Sandaracinus amylolyticus]